ncbi:MAG: carbonic anhydrase [Wenzhouxiangellaceae bacterium]|nr:carbonic anhydrase [Wenzhouxiangellaceae bacterium]
MPEDLIRRNRKWAEQQLESSPDYFSRLAEVQTPKYLWIGCADSRVPAEVLTGSPPGELFVHRNIANIVHPDDMGLLGVLEFGINALGIRRIVVCGHTGCGGVRAAAEGCDHGLVDHWLAPVRQLYRRHGEALSGIEDEQRRLDRLAELNVARSVALIAENPIVQAARARGDEIEIEGMLYALGDGLLHKLDCS